MQLLNFRVKKSEIKQVVNVILGYLVFIFIATILSKVRLPENDDGDYVKQQHLITLLEYIFNLIQITSIASAILFTLSFYESKTFSILKFLGSLISIYLFSLLSRVPDPQDFNVSDIIDQRATAFAQFCILAIIVLALQIYFYKRKINSCFTPEANDSIMSSIKSWGKQNHIDQETRYASENNNIPDYNPKLKQDKLFNK